MLWPCIVSLRADLSTTVIIGGSNNDNIYINIINVVNINNVDSERSSAIDNRPNIGVYEMIQINRNELKKYLYLLLDICPKQEIPLYRAPDGILLDTTKKDGTAILAATDGYRMLHCEIPCYIDDRASYIIPRTDVKIIYDLLCSKSHHGEHIVITYIHNSLTLKFCIGEHYYTTRLLDGQFPNYERYITSDYSTQCELTEPIGLNPKHLAHLGKWRTEVVAVKISTTKRPVYFMSDDYPGMMYITRPVDIGEV
jgi:hypothetical protein